MTTEPRAEATPMISVRRIHRRDLNRVWDFLKLVFREVNRETVEYQRPRSKKRFLEVYEEEGVEQLLFTADKETGDEIVGYAECAFEISGSDNWMNERYFERKDMRPLFVEELAVHPGYQGRGVGNFMLEQVEHIAKLRGCTHLVLEVAENNDSALGFYRKRSFYKLDSAIFLAKRVIVAEEFLPPRKLKKRGAPASEATLEKSPKPEKQASAKGLKKNAASAKKIATIKMAPPKLTQKSAAKPIEKPSEKIADKSSTLVASSTAPRKNGAKNGSRDTP